MSDVITNGNCDTSRWLKAVADWEHDPEPQPRYEDVLRQRRVYESGGFGGAYSPPSGALEP